MIHDLCQLKLAGDPNLQERVFRVPALAGKGLMSKPFPAKAGTLTRLYPILVFGL